MHVASTLCVSVLFGLTLSLVSAERAEAQSARLVGSANGAVILDGPLAANGPLLGGEIGAGGREDDGTAIPDKICDVAETTCFDESAAGLDIGGIISVSRVSTTGGSPTAGFPRVESEADGVFLGINGLLEVGIARSRAIADASTGELSGETFGVFVRLANAIEIPVPAGETLDIPGIGTLLAGRKRVIEDGDLKLIEVDGAVLESETLGNIVLGRTTAGIELAGTSGGSFGGEDGCSVAPGHESADGALLPLLAAFLLWRAYRRRDA